MTYQRAGSSTRGHRVFYTLSPVTHISLRTLGGRDQDSGCNPIITLMSFICSARCLDTIAVFPPSLPPLRKDAFFNRTCV